LIDEFLVLAKMGRTKAAKGAKKPETHWPPENPAQVSKSVRYRLATRLDFFCWFPEYPARDRSVGKAAALPYHS
jgi:hypothetical protein